MNNAQKTIRPMLRWEPPPVYLMHIPKTGGTSLRYLISSAYRPRQVFIAGRHHDLSQVTLTELAGYRCYISHFGVSFLALLNHPGLACLTMLRDPVEQSISYIYFRQKQLLNEPWLFKPDELERMLPFAHADLHTCLENPDFARYARNPQALNLGRIRDLRPLLKDGMAAHSIPDDDSIPDMNGVLEQARRQLDVMAVVGLTERFAESVELVCALLGIPTPAQTPQRNIGPRKTGVDLRGYRASTPPELIEQVEELTRYDHELYAYACDLFEQQWARHRANPRRSYSIAPRVRVWGRRGIRAVWQRVRGALPGLDNQPAVLRLKRKVKGRLQ